MKTSDIITISVENELSGCTYDDGCDTRCGALDDPQPCLCEDDCGDDDCGDCERCGYGEDDCLSEEYS